MKTITLIIIILLGSLAYSLTLDGKRVDIIQTAAHPALDSTYKGIVDELAAKKIEIKFANAQGDLNLSNQIAKKFISEKPDAIISIATLASQSIANSARNRDIPIVFSSVTDPAGAGLDKENMNITGVSNFIKLDEQLALFKQILPNMTKLGFIYNPGEVNSVKILESLREISGKYTIEIIVSVASKTTEVSSASNKLIGKVDAIFISNDNTALAAFGVIAKIASNAKIPIFVSDTDMVESGALASLGPNQYELGKQTANMLIQILQGKQVKDLPIEYPQKIELVLNQKIAKELGIKFSDEILNKDRRP